MQLSSLAQDYSWLASLEARQRQLIQLSLQLWEREAQVRSELYDYSFVLFPMAKAYEGFLKQYFFQLGLINERLYQSRKFRIGRALNPDVRPQHRNGEWLYDDLERACGREVARNLWDVWLTCRNQTFHYFPDKNTTMSLVQAGESIELVLGAIDQAQACRLEPRAPAR